MVAATVARCRELGWVGDETYAHERARALRARGSGGLRIAADLEARGFAAELVAGAVETSREGESELGLARRALAWARLAVRTPRDRARAARWLVQRGFDEDVIRELLGEPEW